MADIYGYLFSRNQILIMKNSFNISSLFDYLFALSLLVTLNSLWGLHSLAFDYNCKEKLLQQILQVIVFMNHRDINLKENIEFLCLLHIWNIKLHPNS